MLQVDGVQKSYGTTPALAGVDLSVERGQIVALLGPNGAGKTSLLSIIAGLLKPDRGSVRIDGISVTEEPHAARRHLGFAPQEVGTYRTVTVEENLRFAGELGGLRRRHLRRRVGEVAETFSLNHLLSRKGQALSGGEARRLHIAMSVVHSPPLLLLDEPTAGVDVQSRNQFLHLVESLAKEGSAIVYSTHYLHEVEQLDVTRVAILVSGKIVASAPIPHLVETGGGGVVELRFAGTPPRLQQHPGAVQVGDDTLRVPAGEVPAATAAGLLRNLDGIGVEPLEIKLMQPSLENVFLSLVSVSERDSENTD